MPHRLEVIISAAQWGAIMGIGFFTSTVPMYQADWQKMVWTVLSMVAGTIVSHYVKKWLNRK